MFLLGSDSQPFRVDKKRARFGLGQPYRFAIVVGASSGIGAELVRQLAQSGCRVAAVARRKERLDVVASEYPEHVLAVEHDVRNLQEIPALFQDLCGRLGGLDLIIYAAGVMPRLAPNEYSTQDDAEIVAVNLVGAVAWLNEAAVRFQNTNLGSIVAIGSVAGDRGRAGQPVYNASKAALATYMEALRNRLSRQGVSVVTIKPGPVATDMTAGLGFKGAMSAHDAARKILTLSRSTGEHYLKLTHRLIFAVIRRIPSPIFRRLKI